MAEMQKTSPDVGGDLPLHGDNALNDSAIRFPNANQPAPHPVPAVVL
jgi:hypothetical protein